MHTNRRFALECGPKTGIFAARVGVSYGKFIVSGSIPMR